MEPADMRSTTADRRPRMLFLAPWYLPAFSGGAPRLFDDLLRGVQRFDVTVVADRTDADPAELAAFDAEAPAKRGYSMRRVPSYHLRFHGKSRLSHLLEIGSFYRRGLRELRACVDAVRPDIIVTGNSYPTGWLLNRLSFPGPTVHYVHGEEMTMALRDTSTKRWLKREQIRSLRNVDRIICVSRFSAERVAEEVSWDHISLLPNAVDIRRFSPPADREALRQRFGWSGRTVLLTIARLVERKGVDNVLLALSEAETLPPDWLYVIGGRGPMEPRLREIVRERGLEDRVRFLGFVPDDDLADLYGAADLFVQPNREVSGDTEGFGIVFLEANACGTPVIGGLAGGTADAIENGVSGLRVDGDDRAAVRRAIVDLMTDADLRRKMGRQGLERAVRDFSVDTLVGKFEDILESTMASPRR